LATAIASGPEAPAGCRTSQGGAGRRPAKGSVASHRDGTQTASPSRCRNDAQAAIRVGRRTIVKFRVELVWTDGAENAASSIFLTADGRVILQGRAISPQERQALALPAQGDMISVDRDLIRAIKDML
jgi:hypothetical protein